MDKLLLDVFYYLDKCSVRQSNLKPEEEQLLLNSKLFKHGSICWPSIGCCLPGLLASLRALYRFLRIEEYEATKPAVCVKARNLKVIFQSPSNELFCHFLALAIRPFRNVNKIPLSSAPHVHKLNKLMRENLLQELLERFVCLEQIRPKVTETQFRNKQYVSGAERLLEQC